MNTKKKRAALLLRARFPVYNLMKSGKFVYQ